MASQSIGVTSGQQIKVDYAFGLNSVTTANYTLDAEFRLYRDGVLIATRGLDRVGASAGTQRYPIANTYVDTAVATGTSTYDVRVIITTATNITSSAAINRNLNMIAF